MLNPIAEAIRLLKEMADVLPGPIKAMIFVVFSAINLDAMLKQLKDFLG